MMWTAGNGVLLLRWKDSITCCMPLHKPPQATTELVPDMSLTVACLGQVLSESTLSNPGSTLMILRGSLYPTIPNVVPEGQRHDLYSHEYSRVTPTLLNILSLTYSPSTCYPSSPPHNTQLLSSTQLQTPLTMSFLGGAECSTAGNPLSQFSKIGSDDKSLQRDRLVGRPAGSAQGMRSNQMNGSQDNVRS